MAKDGDLQLLTPEVYALVHAAAAWVGLGFIGLALLMLVKRSWSFVFLDWTLRFPGWFFRTFWTDLRRLVGGFRPTWRSFGVALLLTLAALSIRIPFIEMPMRHDEAYSITYFSAAPLKFTLEDYTFPNNHVFHNVLVNLIYHNLGKEPWKMRLPTFVAGLLAVPAAFSLAKRWYGLNTGLLAAMLIGTAPVLIDYGANARGYSLLALLTLITLRLATYLKENRNLAGWMLLSVLGALAFFTLPTALFPMGILYMWLFLSLLSGDIGKEYRAARFFGYLVFSGFGMLVLTFLCYTPLFLRSGWDSFFNNSYVARLSWQEFWPTLASRLDETWREWNWDVPPVISVLAVIGLIFSIIWHRRLTHQRVSLQLASAAWVIPLLFIQRPNAWAKIWLFLLPLLLIWAAAGIAGWMEFGIKKAGRPTLHGVVIILLVGLLQLGGLLRTAQVCPGWVYPIGDVEQTARYIKDHLEPNDIVIVAPIEDAPMWYYAKLYGFHDRLSRTVLFFRAYALVNPEEAQTLERVMDERGPDRVFLDYSTAKKVQQFGDIELHTVDSFRDRVIEAYDQIDKP